MPKDLRSRRTTPLLAPEARTDRSVTRLMKEFRAHGGSLHPSRTRWYHVMERRSNALLWSANRTAAPVSPIPPVSALLRQSCTCSSMSLCAVPSMSLQSWVVRSLSVAPPADTCVAKCRKARLMLGPQLPPALEAWSGLMWPSISGPATLARAAPKSLRRHVGSWRGLISEGYSPPIFFKIHTRRSIEGPSTPVIA